MAEGAGEKEKWQRDNGNAMFTFIIATFRAIIPQAKRYRAQSIADRYLARPGAGYHAVVVIIAIDKRKCMQRNVTRCTQSLPSFSIFLSFSLSLFAVIIDLYVSIRKLHDRVQLKNLFHYIIKSTIFTLLQ